MNLALAPTVVAAAAGKAPPLIDIDSTVLVQLVLFLLIAFILSRLLFRPFLKVRADREEGIEGGRAAAQRMDEEAKARVADYEAQLAKAKTGAEGHRVKLRMEATEREREVTEAARAESQRAVEDARRKLALDAGSARKSLEARTGELARDIARRVLGREVA